MKETLPEKLAADIDAANDSTPLSDLVKLGVALAQARYTGHDTFLPALKLKNLIAPHVGEEPLKTMVGLKQCKTAGTATSGGVFSIMMRGLDGGELEAWLGKPENLAGFAAGLEDAAAVLVSPGVVDALGSLVAGWENAIGAAPETVAKYMAVAEAHRRISEAYASLFPGTRQWYAPGDSHTGLVAVMAAAKNEQLTGDPSTILVANAKLSEGLKLALDDSGAMTALGANRDLVSTWMDSGELMGAVWDSPTATEALLKSEVFRDEFLKETNEGNPRVGYRLLLQNQKAWASFLANTAARQDLWKNKNACKTMWASPVARQEMWAEAAALNELTKNTEAVDDLTRNYNPQLQDAREIIAATVRNSKGKFVKVSEVNSHRGGILDDIACRYENSVILAMLGTYTESPGTVTTIVHKNGVVVASRNDGVVQETVTVVSGVSFTGATFTHEERSRTAIEIWQAA